MCLKEYGWHLYYGSQNGPIKVWTQSGKCVQTLQTGNWLSCLKVHQGLLYSVSHDGIKVWDEFGKCLQIFAPHTNYECNEWNKYDYDTRLLKKYGDFLCTTLRSGVIIMWKTIPRNEWWWGITWDYIPPPKKFSNEIMLYWINKKSKENYQIELNRDVLNEIISWLKIKN